MKDNLKVLDIFSFDLIVLNFKNIIIDVIDKEDQMKKKLICFLAKFN